MRLMGWHMSVGTDPCMRVACACSEFTKCSWKCSRNRMTMSCSCKGVLVGLDRAIPAIAVRLAARGERGAGS